MYSITGIIQNDPEKLLFVSPSQYYDEAKKEFEDSSIISLKISTMIFRAACIGKGLHKILFNDISFNNFCERIILRYMIDGNVCRVSSLSSQSIGSVVFNPDDYDYYQFSRNKDFWIQNGENKYEKQVAVDIWKKYNLLVQQLFAIQNRTPLVLSYFENDYDVVPVDIENVDLCYIAIDMERLRETIYTLNRLYKKAEGSSIDFFETTLCTNERLYESFISSEGPAGKRKEIGPSISISRDRPILSQEFYEYRMLTEKQVADKIRCKILKILNAVDCYHLSGLKCIVDLEKVARATQLVTLISMIAIDYYVYVLKLKFSNKDVIINFWFKSDDFSKACYKKLRDCKMKGEFKRKDPELYKKSLNVCRQFFPDFELQKNNYLDFAKDYAFLIE